MSSSDDDEKIFRASQAVGTVIGAGWNAYRTGRHSQLTAQLRALVEAATTGRYAEAVRIGEGMALPTNTVACDQAIYNFMLGLAYVATDRFDQALSRLRAAEQYNQRWDSTREEQAKVHSWIAQAYFGKWVTTGQSDHSLLEQARDAIDAGISLCPGNSDLRQIRSTIIQALGQTGPSSSPPAPARDTSNSSDVPGTILGVLCLIGASIVLVLVWGAVFGSHPAIGSPAGGATPAPTSLVNSVGWQVKMYNVNDHGEIRLNGAVIATADRAAGTAWLDLNDKLRPGDNTIVLSIWNTDLDYSWGFALRYNGASVWQDEVGEGAQEGTFVHDFSRPNRTVYYKTMIIHSDGTFTVSDTSTSDPNSGQTTVPMTLTPEPSLSHSVMHVSTKGLHMRSGPGTDYEVVNTLAQDTEVTLLGESRTVDDGLWVKVDVHGKTGWVNKRYLR